MEDIDFAEVLEFTDDDRQRAVALATQPDDAARGRQAQLLCALARAIATVPFDQLDPDTVWAVLDDLKFNATEVLGELDDVVATAFHGDEFTNLPEFEGDQEVPLA